MKIATWNINSIRLRKENVINFLKKENIDAFNDIIKRLIEAQQRELWKPNRNSIGAQLVKHLEKYDLSS